MVAIKPVLLNTVLKRERPQKYSQKSISTFPFIAFFYQRAFFGGLDMIFTNFTLL